MTAVTSRTLTTIRNRLLAAVILLFAVNIPLGAAFHFRLPDWSLLGGYGVFLSVGTRLIYVLTVYRVAQLLGNPRWVPLVYAGLAVLAGFELIPLVLLLIGIRRARGQLDDSIGQARV